LTSPYTGTGTYTATVGSIIYVPPPCVGFADLPDGGVKELPDGAVGAPGSCSGNEYILAPYSITTGSLCVGALGCADTVDGGFLANYALCSGGSYSTCSAFPPTDGGWVEVPLPQR